jgi:hypothetical protein
MQSIPYSFSDHPLQPFGFYFDSASTCHRQNKHEPCHPGMFELKHSSDGVCEIQARASEQSVFVISVRIGVTVTA